MEDEDSEWGGIGEKEDEPDQELQKTGRYLAVFAIC